MSRYIPQYFPIYEIPSTETTNASPFTHAFLVKDAGDGPYAARYPSNSRAVWFWQIPVISPAPADICRGRPLPLFPREDACRSRSQAFSSRGRSVLPAGASQCPDAVNGQAGCWFLHLPRFLCSAARGLFPPAICPAQHGQSPAGPTRRRSSSLSRCKISTMHCPAGYSVLDENAVTVEQAGPPEGRSFGGPSLSRLWLFVWSGERQADELSPFP